MLKPKPVPCKKIRARAGKEVAECDAQRTETRLTQKQEISILVQNSGMNSSTGLPALTISMTLRGFSSFAASSSMLWQPTIFLPLPRPLMKSSTLLTVLLKQAAV